MFCGNQNSKEQHLLEIYFLNQHKMFTVTIDQFILFLLNIYFFNSLIPHFWTVVCAYKPILLKTISIVNIVTSFLWQLNT